MKIKFLFINAINAADSIEARYPPLGIGYLCSSLRSRFGNAAFEFKVIDKDLESQISIFAPHIVGISSVSQNYNKTIKYAEIAKRLHIPVICGGVHISMLPYSLSKDMDIGVIGEGEETICDVLELFIRRQAFPAEDLRNIRGIAFWGADGKISITGKRGLVTPLDKVPFPARDVLNILPDTYMFTSRGCPYRCTFCASSRFWDKVRLFSAGYVVKEITHLMNEYNVKSINLYDDLFAIDTGRIREIVKLLRSNNILGKIDFSCAIRANLVSDETIDLLQEMGVKSIGLGLESGCEETVKYLKHDVSVNDNINAVKIIRKHKISTFGSFIIGSPLEEEKDALETLKFIKKTGLDGFNIYVLTPYPGTPVWDWAKSRGLVSDNMDWDKLNINFEDNNKSFILLSEKLSKENIRKLIFQFKRYAKIKEQKREISRLIKKGMRHPDRIITFLKEGLKCRIRK